MLTRRDLGAAALASAALAPEPIEGGGEGEDAEEGLGGFFVAGCDRPPLLESRPEVLDQCRLA